VSEARTQTRITLAREGGHAPEAYRLRAGAECVEIRASDDAGIGHGVSTLLQLLPPAVFRRSPVADVPWLVPAIEIVDRPRFGWRGSHLDVGRHFMPKETILKHLDLLALHKLNVFHWHLTEDQGWRIEIRRYPRLTEVGAWRKDTMIPPSTTDPSKRRFAGRPHGGFYTQDDVREVVRYAMERGITVVPEIEMPGHARAAIAAYPHIGNDGTAPPEVATYWGIFDEVMGVHDEALDFAKGVLEEVLELFPSEFVHVGGDEVPKTEWQRSREAQRRMRELGLRDEEQLQSWFITQLDTWLAERGRRLIGWDEILEGGLAPGATVMSWRGEEGGIAAAKAGHDVVMAPNTPTYLNYYQSADPNEPPAHGGVNSLEDVYGYEPLPEALSAHEATHVLGAQAQLWTEYIPDPKHMEYMLWPRLAAMSEVLWSQKQRRDYASFRERLPMHLERLRILDVNFRKPSDIAPVAD
jgi:hexosaminidase